MHKFQKEFQTYIEFDNGVIVLLPTDLEQLGQRMVIVDFNSLKNFKIIVNNHKDTHTLTYQKENLSWQLTFLDEIFNINIENLNCHNLAEFIQLINPPIKIITYFPELRQYWWIDTDIISIMLFRKTNSKNSLANKFLTITYNKPLSDFMLKERNLE